MSTYNKSLPKPSEIRWMNSKRTGRTETIEMPFGGTIPSGVSYIGWRQSSYAYSYQVQYMVKARMVPDKQLETGTEITKTAWKYPNPSWSGDVNTFNKCVTMDKKNRYYRYFNYSGKSLMTKGSYDKLQLVVRVRSFNSKKKQHGSWVTNTLTVKCKPNVTVYKIVALADGGIQIYLNTHGWKRGDSKVILNDARHSGATKKQNKKKLTDEVGSIGTEEASGYPYAEFSGDGFNTDFEQNETIILKNCVFRTCDGVDVSLDGTYTISPIDADISEPRITVNSDSDKGLLSVKIQKADSADDWDDVKAWINCTVNDENVRIDSAESTGSDDSTRMFYFYPPLDSTLKLRIGITNNLGGKFWKTYTKSTLPNLAQIPSEGRVLINYTDGTDNQPSNGVFNGSSIVAMNYDVIKSLNATRQYEKEIPFGRKRPVAFLGEGIERPISVTGTVSNESDMQTVANSHLKDWLDFQEQQGIVLVRLPKGEHYTALCTGLALDQDDEYDESYKVTLSLEEVDI